MQTTAFLLAKAVVLLYYKRKIPGTAAVSAAGNNKKENSSMSDFTCTNAEPVVEVKQGKLKGYEFKDVYRFFGVPYARSRRFEQPKEPRTWEGIRNANAFGYVCPNLSNPAPSDEISVPHRFWPENEHCQNLNIFTPTLDKDAKRPVMVWFHGGGFAAGSAIEQIAYDGDSLAKNDGLVVVTVNHRLNAFGFLDVSDFGGEEFANSGNCGLADLVYSLKWVHENIAAFGGDPENVTIFGQSGGGGKVTALGQTKEAAGLYQKAIVMSGVIGMSLFGGGNPATSKEVVELIMKNACVKDLPELQKLDYRLFIMAVNKTMDDLRAEGKSYGWAPHAGEYYVGDPMDVGFSEDVQKVPTIVGTCMADFGARDNVPGKLDMNAEEQFAYVAATYGEENTAKLKELYEKAYPGKNFCFAKSLDLVFTPGSNDYVKEKAKGSAKNYRYIFAPVFELNGGVAPWHCSDIPFAFRNTEISPYCYALPYRERIAKEFGDAVVAFAKTGDPNTEILPYWAPATPDEVCTMVFDEKSEARVNFDDELLAFFKAIQPPVDINAMVNRKAPEVPDDEAPGGSWAY